MAFNCLLDGCTALSYLRSILLHLAIMAANKDCDVVWNVEEEVILYYNVLHQVPLKLLPISIGASDGRPSYCLM